MQVNPGSAQKVEGSQLWALSTSNQGGSTIQGLGGGGGDGADSGGHQVLLFALQKTVPFRVGR